MEEKEVWIGGGERKEWDGRLVEGNKRERKGGEGKGM